VSTKYSDDLLGIVQGNRIPPSARLGGRVHAAADAFELASDVDLQVNDIVRLCRLPSSAVILECKLAVDDTTTISLTIHVGLYNIDGTVADVDLFGTSIAFDNIPPWLDVRFEAANLDTAGQTLWQMLGLAFDPCKAYDLAITPNAAAGLIIGSATLAYYITYTDG